MYSSYLCESKLTRFESEKFTKIVLPEMLVKFFLFYWPLLKNTKLYSFSFHTARSWNRLSIPTRDATEINAFKNLLDNDSKKEVYV
jgi:hypothetical protein